MCKNSKNFKDDFRERIFFLFIEKTKAYQKNYSKIYSLAYSLYNLRILGQKRIK